MSAGVMEDIREAITTVENETDEEQVVIFNLGDEMFALDIARVQEIVHWREVTRIPKTPLHVEGVINLRGKVFPVIDLRCFFGLAGSAKAKETRIVVVEVNGSVVGLTVDGVSEVVHIQSMQIEPPSRTVTTADSTFLRGIARLDEKLILLMDLEQVVSGNSAQVAVAG